MCHNIFRNSMIIEDIKKCVLEGRVPIVLTERVEHLKILKESLEDLEVPVVVYKGNIGKKKIGKLLIFFFYEILLYYNLKDLSRNIANNLIKNLCEVLVLFFVFGDKIYKVYKVYVNRLTFIR